MNVGRAIRIARAHKGLTQSSLAEESGLSLSYVSLVEQGKREPSLSALKGLTAALGLPLNLLVFMASDSDEVVGVPQDVRDRLNTIVLRLLEETGGHRGQAKLSL